MGIVIPELPDGAIVIEVGNRTYYYAGGAFYLEQSGGYVIAAAPLGVLVPELPPGAESITWNGGPAYEFNGVYYRPLFIDGVTQYQTFSN
jgi:hypothetical protein